MLSNLTMNRIENLIPFFAYNYSKTLHIYHVNFHKFFEIHVKTFLRSLVKCASKKCILGYNPINTEVIIQYD